MEMSLFWRQTRQESILPVKKNKVAPVETAELPDCRVVRRDTFDQSSQIIGN